MRTLPDQGGPSDDKRLSMLLYLFHILQLCLVMLRQVLAPFSIFRRFDHARGIKARYVISTHLYVCKRLAMLLLLFLYLTVVLGWVGGGAAAAAQRRRQNTTNMSRITNGRPSSDIICPS